MKRFKISKLVFVTAVCSMALLFTAPSFSIPACAATPPGAGEISPQADVITWIYERRGNEMWKCLYNTATNEWIGEWIYVGEIGKH